MKAQRSPAAQRGGFLIGFVIGLLVGLAAALGVALYVTKAPNPFVNKVPARSPTQDAAEAERNRNWDPNSALAGHNPAPGTSASGVVSGAEPVRPTLPPPATGDSTAPASSEPVRTARPATGAASAAVARAPAARASQAATSTVAGGPFTYFVQAGAYSTSEDAEQQRAKLAMMGIESRLTEREQGGRVVYRVRVGPFERREDAETTKERLGSSGVDSALVAVQK
jgi:cell division protein FtsN